MVPLPTVLHVHNTLTKRKELFEPAHPKVVRIYTCGLTVYAPMHIGHARTYCFWDLFRRYLEYQGRHVVAVINYTDIDDRIMGAAGTVDGCLDIAEKFAAMFRRDCTALHIKEYAAYTRATDFIDEQIAHIARLIDAGHAYVESGEVFYDVGSFADYGQLSGKVVDDNEVGASGRVTEDVRRKRNPADFTLWKPSAPGQPSWDTGHPAWPSGRPGWHIECSAMSTTLLGETFDVHGGGIDNLFPHHENEVAQSQPLCSTRWVRYWLHPEHLDLRDEQTGKSVKMSKSIGNVVSVPDLLSRLSYDEVRWFFATTHYRSKLQVACVGNDVNWAYVEQALAGYQRVKRLLEVLREQIGDPRDLDEAPAGRYASLEPSTNRIPRLRHRYERGEFAAETRAFIDEFVASMDDDLNGPKASAAVFGYVNALYAKGADKPGDRRSQLAAYRALTRHLWVLGIDEVDVALYPELAAECVSAPGTATGSTDKGGDGVVDRLLAMRTAARKAKDFAKGDQIRALLVEAGVEIEDSPQGPRWSGK